MLWGGEERREVALADGEEDPPGVGAGSVGRRPHGRDVDPTVAGGGDPGRPSEGKYRGAGFGCGLGGVGRHLRGEWMGGVDDKVYLSALEVKLKTLDTAETRRFGSRWAAIWGTVVRPATE